MKNAKEAKEEKESATRRHENSRKKNRSRELK
jgi:hypothetical protein